MMRWTGARGGGGVGGARKEEEERRREAEEFVADVVEPGRGRELGGWQG